MPRGWLGVRLDRLTSDAAKSAGIETGRGVLIIEVLAGSPALEAGLRPDDIVVRWRGQPVEDPRRFSFLVAETEPATTVEIEVLRRGERLTLEVEVGRLEDYELASGRLESPITLAERAFNSLGLTLAVIDDDLRKKYGLGFEVRGVVITGVDDDLVEEADLAPGDVIVEVDHAAIGSLSDVEAELRRLRGEESELVVLLRERAGDREFIPVRIRQS